MLLLPIPPTGTAYTLILPPKTSERQPYKPHAFLAPCLAVPVPLTHFSMESSPNPLKEVISSSRESPITLYPSSGEYCRQPSLYVCLLYFLQRWMPEHTICLPPFQGSLQDRSSISIE